MSQKFGDDKHAPLLAMEIPVDVSPHDCFSRGPSPCYPQATPYPPPLGREMQRRVMTREASTRLTPPFRLPAIPPQSAIPPIPAINSGEYLVLDTASTSISTAGSFGSTRTLPKYLHTPVAARPMQRCPGVSLLCALASTLQCHEVADEGQTAIQCDRGEPRYGGTGARVEAYG